MAIAGYELEIDGGAPVDVGLPAIVTGKHQYDVTGLDVETEYEFRVRAYDDAGNRGDWSDAIQVSTDPPYHPLTAHSWLGYFDAFELALSNGAAVDPWPNQGTGGDLANPGGGSTSPTYVTSAAVLGNNPAVLFDADTESLKATLGATGQCTMWFLFHKPNAAAVQDYMMHGNYTFEHRFYNFAGDFYFQQQSVTRVTHAYTAGPHIVRIEYGASTTKMFLNDVDITDDNTSTQKPGADIWLGQKPAHNNGVTEAWHLGLFAVSNGLITGADADTAEAFWTAQWA